jgi:hypothetical protein
MSAGDLIFPSTATTATTPAIQSILHSSSRSQIVPKIGFPKRFHWPAFLNAEQIRSVNLRKVTIDFKLECLHSVAQHRFADQDPTFSREMLLQRRALSCLLAGT